MLDLLPVLQGTVQSRDQSEDVSEEDEVLLQEVPAV